MTGKETTESSDALIAGIHAAYISSYETTVLQVLYDIEEGYDQIELHLGEVKSDWKGGDQSESEGFVDSLGKNLGIQPTQWLASFVGGSINRGLYSEVALRPKDMRHSARLGQTIGQVLVGYAYDALPIEMNEEGESIVELSFAVGDDHVVSFEAKGLYWTEYYDVEVKEYGEEVDDDDEQDEASSSEIGYSIECKATVNKSAL